MNRWKQYLRVFLVIGAIFSAGVALPAKAFAEDLVVYSSVDEENENLDQGTPWIRMGVAVGRLQMVNGQSVQRPTF